MEFHFRIQCSCITTTNQRGLNKPNEDYYLTDEANQIYMVLDGVTRNHDEYTEMQQESPARTVSQLFAASVQRMLGGEAVRQKAPPEIKRILREAVEQANRDVAAYCAGKQWRYLPATVCVICMIIEQTAYYAYIGDCIGMLLRDGQKIRFTQEQTKLLSLFKEQFTKEQIQTQICNRAAHPYGYGVINGEPAAMDFLRISHIRLEPGDTLLLASDGLSALLEFAPPEALQKEPLEGLIQASKQYDTPPFHRYTDDKTLVRLQIE
ncbi:MAG: PP2C family protein-serine/threonine phosphatase [Oscillospiraceae bacterium]